MNKQHPYITVDEAMELHKKAGFGIVVTSTMRTWLKKYGFGLKIGGRWKVDKKKFERFLAKGTYCDDSEEA